MIIHYAPAQRPAGDAPTFRVWVHYFCPECDAYLMPNGELSYAGRIMVCMNSQCSQRDRKFIAPKATMQLEEVR